MTALPGLLMPASRLLLFSATLVLCGSPLFFLYALDPRSAAALADRRGWPQRLLQVAAATALLSVLVWLPAQSAVLYASPRDALRWSSLSAVLLDTRFGRIAALRAVLAAMSTAILATGRITGRRLWVVQAWLGAMMVGTLAWTGHGAMSDGRADILHLAGDLLHLLGAAIWIGALLPLSVMLARLPQRDGREDVRRVAEALTRFSRCGVPLVWLIAVTGLANTGFMLQPAGWQSGITTAYGRLLLAKVGLFVLMLVLAAVNRFELVPRLRAVSAGLPPPETTVRRLRATLGTEIALALAILAIVAQLGVLPPPSSGP